MVYLNNAATTFPKPATVIEAQAEALRRPPVNPLRSNLAGGDTLTELRKALGRLFNISDWERIFFASSATDAINRVLGGIGYQTVQASRDSHNSVLRPVANLLPTAARHASPLASCLHIVNHCSNVTGEVSPVRPVADGLLMLDAAQSAGCVPVDVDGWGVDVLVFTGHKALFGPTGTGGYYVRRNIELRPTQFGGTGRDSSVVKYEEGDWEYEVGTQNLVGLAGLKAGVDHVLSRGVENIWRQERELSCWLIDRLAALPGVTVYSPGGQWQGPVVSFNVKGLNPADVGYILQNSYDITVRTGLHCAPLVHEQLGTLPYGTVRASLSDFTTKSDLSALVDAVKEISKSL